MNPLFKPDPVIHQRGRVKVALAEWQLVLRGVNDPTTVPARLRELMAQAELVVDPLYDNAVATLVRVDKEFAGIVFPGDPDDPMKALERETLIVQSSLRNLRQIAINAGYADKAESADTPLVPQQVVADKLDALEKSIEGVKDSADKIRDAQAEDQSRDQPPLQAPLVQNFVERMTINMNFTLFKMQGNKIDFSGIAGLVKETRGLIRDFLTTTATFTVSATHWLRTQATSWLVPASDALGKATSAVVTKAKAWVQARTVPAAPSKPAEPKRSEEDFARDDAPETPPMLDLHDPGPPPDDFDIEIVKTMILRGKAPPEAWVPWIRELEFVHSRLENLEPLIGLKNLVMLDLINTRVSDLGPLAKLQELSALIIHHSRANDLAPLRELKNLSSLEVAAFPITDIAPLADLHNLTNLILWAPNVADISPLASLHRLLKLDLRRTKTKGLWALSGLKKLREFQLSGNDVTDLTPLAGLSSLSKLYIDTPDFKDLAPISNLHNLSNINLSGTNVEDLGPVTSLKHLTRIRVDRTIIKNLNSISELHQLRLLTVANTRVTNLTPISNLKNLTTLDLSYTAITDLAPLQDLDNLLQLHLLGTNIKSLSTLRKLPRLNAIYVDFGLVGPLTASFGRKNIVQLAPWDPRSSSNRRPKP